MRTTPAALVTHFSSGSSKPAFLIKLTRIDGEIFGVTNHDVDITYDGTTYAAALGVDMSSIKTSSQMSVDNLDVKGFLAQIGVNEFDIAAGLWDFCDVRIYRVNWADLTMGDEKPFRGWFGELSIGRSEFTAELRSLTQKLQSDIGETVTELCKADLYDTRCGVVLTEGVNMFSGVSVSTLVLTQRQFTATALTQAVDFFTAGTVEWLTGANAGLVKEIKLHTAGGNILLQEPMPYEISAGSPADTFTIKAGCLKRYQEDCITKHNNGTRFRGFPFIPGDDALLRGPL